MTRSLVFTIVVIAANLAVGMAQSELPGEALIGRWDLTVQLAKEPAPSWLEVRRSGLSTLVGQFVGSGGSARPIAKIEFSNGEFRFAIPPQWERDPKDISFVGRLDRDRLSGTMTMGDGQQLTWSGSRAPALRRESPPSWGKPVALLNGKDLTGWHVLGENQWRIADGVLQNLKGGGNLVTDQKFTDFKLHVEVRVPKGGNSGVYLRGRYELQIDDSYGIEPSSSHLGGVYGFIAPSEAAVKPAGEWQRMDATLIGRMLTLELNGRMVICNREIPGITGGALDSNEGDPGPLLLQGDHGPIEFRNIIVTPAA